MTISTARLWMFAMLAGSAAGLGSWLVGEAVVGRFTPALHGVNRYGTMAMMPDPASIHAAEAKNGVLAIAILGGVLGPMMGLAGGLARGDVRAALGAAVAGLAIGAGVGTAASWAGGLAYRAWFDTLAENLAATLAFHGGVWLAVGGAGGLAFGLGLGGRRRAGGGLAGGLLGGLVGAIVFELVAAAAFPLDRTYLPVSLSAGSRLLARMAVALGAAAGAALAVPDSGGRATSVAANPPPLAEPPTSRIMS